MKHLSKKDRNRRPSSLEKSEKLSNEDTKGSRQRRSQETEENLQRDESKTHEGEKNTPEESNGQLSLFLVSFNIGRAEWSRGWARLIPELSLTGREAVGKGHRRCTLNGWRAELSGKARGRTRPFPDAVDVMG